jgi:hypothetical protein
MPTAADEGYTKGRKALEVDSGSEEREVMLDAIGASHASTSTSMSSTHHVGQFAFNLWARLLIGLLPFGVGLFVSGAMERFVLGVYADRSPVLRRSTRIA